MLKQPNSAIFKVVVVIWLTLSVGSVVLAAISWAQLSAGVSAAQELTLIQRELDEIFISLLDVETGVRGYVIANDKQYLRPLNEVSSGLPGQFDHLVELTKGNSDLLKGVTDLRAQTELLMNYYHEIADARDFNFSKAEAMITSDDGKKIMDGIRRQVTQLDKMDSDRLTFVRAEISAQLFHANLTSLVAGVVGLGAGVFAFWLSRLTLRHQQRESELMEAKLQAEHSNQEKTVFLANMSHEIRTPMNAILGFSELLQGDLREPKHRQYLQSIHSSARSLLQLMNDILDMSKIEAGMMDLRPESTDLNEVCDFIRTLFSEPAAKKGIKLECRVAEDLPRALLVDRIRLRQVLVNLVGNAVKFTDKGGVETRVLWEKQDGGRITLIMEVQDTGVGIPQDKLGAIFKPFVQAGADHDKEKQGTGLGLSIVKRLTEVMGGAVTVTSTLGQGSVFRLRFPDVPMSARLPSSEKLSATAKVNFNELKPAALLVVDDNETNCQLLAAMFADTHHRLTFSSKAEEVVGMAREIKPDVILLDVRMPRMNGREVLAQIRKTAGLELTPVIAVTASSLTGEDNFLKTEFSGYVRKPFSKSELFAELAEFLPRLTQPEPEAPEEISLETDIVVSGPAAEELVVHLRRLLGEEWPAIRDSAAINESKTFARNLKNLGQQWRCQPLIAYAQRLLRDAENYAVTDLEKHLRGFSALVEELDPAAKT